MSFQGLHADSPTVRILIVGDCGSGKGALARQLCYGDSNAEDDPSSGCELHTCVCIPPPSADYAPGPVFVELMVAPGYRRHESSRSHLYHAADAVAIVFDARGRRTPTAVPQWLAETRRCCREAGFAEVASSRPRALTATGEAMFTSSTLPPQPAAPVRRAQFGVPVALLGTRWGGRPALHRSWPQESSLGYLGPYFASLADPMDARPEHAALLAEGRGEEEDADSDVEAGTGKAGSGQGGAACITALVGEVLRRQLHLRHQRGHWEPEQPVLWRSSGPQQQPQPASWVPRMAVSAWGAALRALGYRDDRLEDRGDYAAVRQHGEPPRAGGHGGPEADVSIRRRSTSGAARAEMPGAAMLGRTLSPAMELDEPTPDLCDPYRAQQPVAAAWVPQQTHGWGLHPTPVPVPAPGMDYQPQLYGGLPGYAVASYDLSTGTVMAPQSYGYGVMDEEDEKRYNGGSLYDE